MEENKLYFIKDTYFEKYDHDDIQENKESDGDDLHDRPCYYAFRENDIFWMIPISSKVEKYERIYNKAVEKYGHCDTISFVYIKGAKNAALIQNMIPVTQQYINNIYTYSGTEKPIEINDNKKREINAKTRKVLRFTRQGKKLTFTPILDIVDKLLQDENHIN